MTFASFALATRKRLPAKMLAALLLALPAATTLAQTSAAKVGVTELSVVPPAADFNWRGAQERSLHLVIWYPADPAAKEEPLYVGPPGKPLFNLESVAVNAKPASGGTKLPLILLSHGTGGAAGQMAWLGRALAAKGYIAAAVDHPGNNALAPHTLEGFSLWWERAGDISTVLDALLKDERIAPYIDADRIGAAGFSLGGYTMMALAGGITQPSRLREYCASNGANDMTQCRSPAEYPDLAAKIRERLKTDADFQKAFNHASTSRRDARIRAFFAIAPALAPAFDPQSLASITAPVAIVNGDADDIVPPNGPELLATHIPGATHRTLKGVGHYTYLALCAEHGKTALPRLCTDAPGIDRERVHDETSRLAVDFFNTRLH